jgi:hypothetical protein
VEYYRELKLDDPFRRNDREKKSPNDDGDLFGLRRRARKLRVLLDVDSLKEPSTYDERETVTILMSLIEYNDEIVHLWRIDMSKVDEPDSKREEPGLFTCTAIRATKVRTHSLPGRRTACESSIRTGERIQVFRLCGKYLKMLKT